MIQRPRIRLFCNLFACCLLVIGLAGTPLQMARSASIATDGEIIGDDVFGGGVSIDQLKVLLCETATAAGISPQPKMCLLDPGERFVFATSTTSGGDLGGLQGADDTCNALAAAASLPGTYRAWLSTSTGVNAKDRIGDHLWKLPNGVKVADDLDDLIDGFLDAPISRDENGFLASYTSTWTGTNLFGTFFIQAGIGDCNNWTAPLNEFTFFGRPYRDEWKLDIGNVYDMSRGGGHS